MGSGILWKILVTQHSPPPHQEMQLEMQKRTAFINFAQKHRWVLGARSNLRWTERQWKRGQTSSHFSLFLGKWTLDSMCQRWTKPSRLLPTKSAKTNLCDGVGVHQCPRHGWSAHMWRHHWCGGLCWNFGETYCCCPDDDFSQEFHIYSSRTMQGLILHEIQPRGFVGIECVCLTGLPAVQLCLLFKRYGASGRRESDNRDSCITLMRNTEIPLGKFISVMRMGYLIKCLWGFNHIHY